MPKVISYYIKIIKALFKTWKYAAGFLITVSLIVLTGVIWASAVKFSSETINLYPKEYYLSSSDEIVWGSPENALVKELEEDAVVDDFNSSNSAFNFSQENEPETLGTNSRARSLWGRVLAVFSAKAQDFTNSDTNNSDTEKDVRIEDIENINIEESKDIPVENEFLEKKDEEIKPLEYASLELYSFSLEELKNNLAESKDKKTIDIIDLSLLMSFASFPDPKQGNRLHVEAYFPGKKKHTIALIQQDTYYSNNLNDGYFSYSLEPLFGEMEGNITSSDIEQLAISITAISETGEFAPTYLDAVWLEMDYRSEKLATHRPKVKVRKGEYLSPSKESFSSKENIEFVFTNPNLTIQDLRNKIERNEAEIIEDKYRKLSDKNIILELLEEKSKEEEKSTNWGAQEEPPGYISPFENDLNNEEFPAFENVNTEEEEIENNTQEPNEEDANNSKDIDDSNKELLEEDVVQDPEPKNKEKEQQEENIIDTEDSGEEISPIAVMYSLLLPKTAYAQSAAVLEDFDFFLVDPGGNRTPVNASIIKTVENGNEIFTATIEKTNREFIPGKYTLEVELHTREAITVLQQDFTWGVLALNINKSMYTPEDEHAYIQMGVLDDYGHTICDADLELKVLSPNFNISTLSTKNGSIAYSDNCLGDSFSETPDYYAYYDLFGELGIYEIELTATTKNGTYSVSDSFTVYESVLFDVERSGPTRVYPVDRYSMNITVKANQDFVGNIIDFAPNSFQILNTSADISEIGNNKEISWEVDVQEGDILELKYDFDAPDISPEFYLLGPLTFTHEQQAIGERIIFKEDRQWQIANDDVLSTLLVDGNGVSGPRNWNTQAFGDIDEGVSSADGTEIAAATGAGNRNISLDTSFTFANTPVNFQTMDSISYNVRYRASSNVGDDTLTFGIRIVNGGTILAAGDNLGAFETVLSSVNTGWHTGLQNSGAITFTYINQTANKAAWDGAEIELRSTHAQQMGPEDNFVIVDTLELTGTYTASATTINISGSSDIASATVALAVNSTRQAETATTATGPCPCAWTITGVTQPTSGDVVTVWVDGVGDASESTAVTLYAGSGDVTGLELSANILSIGTTGAYANQSISVTNLSQYDADSGSDGGDEDVMHTSNSSILNVEASSNSYVDETIRIEAGDTLTIGGAETLNTHNNQIEGTLTSSGAGSFNISGNWVNNSVFQDSSETVSFIGAESATIDTGCTAYNNCANGNFNNLTVNKTDTDEANDNVTLINSDLNVANTLTITDGELVQGALSVQVEGATTSVSIASAGEWLNDSTGDLYLDGDFINNGIAIFNANGLTCGDADSITITNISNIPDWDGTGIFSLRDITMSNQNAIASINVESSTNNGGNTGNWSFVGCSVTVQGNVLQGDESTFIGATPCDGSTQVVSLRINGGAESTGVCDASGYIFNGLSVGAGDTITVYLNGNSTEKANLVMVAGSGDVLDADIYQDTVIIRDNNDSTAAIIDVLDWDSSSDATNMLFDAATGTPDTINVNSGVELHIWTGDTLDPGGTVTAQGDVHVDDSATMHIDDAASVISGDVLVDDSGTFQAQANLSINGGDIITSGTGATFDYANTPQVTISGTGSIGGGTTPTINFYDLVISGTQTIASAVIISNDATVNGTMQGSASVQTVVSGSLSGTGIVNMTGGTIEQRISTNENFGTTSGTNNWTFNNLIFSNEDLGGLNHNIVTQTGGSGSITVNGILNIGKSGDTAGSTTTLDAGNRAWDIAGTGGDPMQILDSPAGVFNAQTSTVEYTGDNGGGNTTIEDANYNALTLTGGETYVPEGAITASSDLLVNTNATLNGTNNITINGSVTGAGVINLTGGTFTQRIGADETFGTTSGTNNWTFNNLTMSNSDTANHSITANSTGSGTTQVTGTFTLGPSGDANTTTLDLETNDRNTDFQVVIIDTNGILTASSTASLTVSGNWTNNGALNEGTGTIEFDGTTSSQIDSGCADFNSCTNENFYNLTINKTSGTDVDDNISLSNTDIRVSNTITITDGELIQGALNVRAEGSTSVSMSAGNSAAWTNTSTGDLTLGGSFNAADAVITFQGSGAGCGDFDSILIRSTDGATQRAWSDSGATFNFNDVDVSDQAGTSSITVNDGTDQGDNGANWTFTGCPGGGSTTYSMRPDTDVAATWAVTGSTCSGAHWCTVNDNIDDPTAGSFTERIDTSGNNITERFTTTSPTDVSTATQIIPKVYTDAIGGSNNMRVQLAVFINGSQVGTTFSCANSTTTATWCSGTAITGSWTQADINTLEIALTSNKNGGGGADTLRVAATYAELTYTPTGITIEGNVYEDESTTALTACDGSTNMITIQIGASTYGPATCANSDGFFSINAITQPGTGAPIFIYIDGVSSTFGTTVIRYGGSGNINNATVRRNIFLVRHDDAGPVTNNDLSGWDNVDDSDIVYDINDSTAELTLEDGIKLVVNAANTFTPGADVTTSSSADGTDSNIDGDILIETSATLGIEANSLSVGGDFENQGTFSKSANQTTTFTATASGHTITDGGSNFENIEFNGISGGWSFSDSTVVDSDITVTNGTLSGTNDVTVNGGDVTGAGSINLTGGTFTIANSDGTNDLGGGTYTFNNLVIGDNDASPETTALSGNITISGILTIDPVSDATNDTLDSGSSTITLSGSGTPLVINGLFDENTGRVDYTGTSATDITPATYYNLESSPAGTVTHTLGTGGGQTITVTNNFDIGNGTNQVTADANSWDPTLNINGSITINNSAIFDASNSGTFQVAQDFTNNGTFNSNGGVIIFDSASDSTIAGDGTSFNDFTSTTSGKNIIFTAGETFTINGLLTFAGVNINSTDTITPTKWIINHQGTESISGTTITNSGCDASSVNIDLYTSGNNTNGGNNDLCWQFDPYTPQGQNWQWFDDETNETPSNSLASENVAPSDIESGNPIKLRLTINETGGWTGSNVKFKLQFSTTSDFSANVNDVTEFASCSGNDEWCYANGVDSDNDAITTRILTDSTASGVHNESGISASTFDHQPGTPTEFEFTIESSGPDANTTYFFRVWDSFNNAAVSLNTGETYPSLTTGGTTLDFEIFGLSSSTTTEGVTTNLATTPTQVSFGLLNFGAEKIAGHRLRVTTNASQGYAAYLYQRQSLTGEQGATIPGVSGTNLSPVDWSTGCPANSSCYGYHAGDNTLSGGSTRFSLDDTYAQFSTNSEEVAYSSVSVTSEDTDMIYRIKVTEEQDADNYQTDLVYIIVPTF